MDRSATVMLTAPGDSNLNRLRVPEFRLVKLQISAGGKTSKCYLPSGPAGGGSDDFHFAPEKEKATIVYEIDDVIGAIDFAELQLYTRFKEAPLWTLDLTKLGQEWYAHGAHEIEWDGRLPAPPTAEQKGAGGGKHKLTALEPKPDEATHPDGYVTIEQSPYKLRLVVKSGSLQGDPTTAWTYFQVLVKKIELEYGDDKMLPAPVAGKGDHRKVLADLKGQNGGKPPAAGGKVKVNLDSNLYKTASAEMFDNTLYTEYQSLWGDGPRIPLVAVVYIRDSGDQAVLAPKALGKAKFLWDWECKSAATPENFVNQAQDYYKDTTKPKGQNAHKDRGGKRADDAKPVFPAEAGYAAQDSLKDGVFPFKTEACPEPRKWATISYAWRDKLLGGKTGVVFQPARLAGDAWAVTCYLAWDHDQAGKLALNVDKDAPLPSDAAVKAVSGTFETWRLAQLRKLIRKCATGMPALGLGTICNCFERAFFKVDNVAGAAVDYSAADWNNEVTSATSGWSDLEKLFLDPGNQHTGGAEGLRVRTRAQFMAAWREKAIRDSLTSMGVDPAVINAIAGPASTAASANAAGNASDAGASATYNATDTATIRAEVEARWNHVTNWMNNPANGFDTAAKHALSMQGKAVAVLIAIFNKKFTYGDGVYIFQVERSHNLVHLQGNMTIGQACDFGNANRQRCGFLLMCPAGMVPCGIDKISAHEIGHHFFLPHPPDTAETRNYKAHDHAYQAAVGGKSSCLMSYNYALAMELCGFCQLRLRGWDKSKLDPDGTKNKKP